MSNPYVSRGPVRSAQVFFGRYHEMEEISAFLKGNQSISIVGPRKIGKTSMLFELMRPAARQKLGLGPDFIFTYLDCEVLGEANHEEIFGQLAAEIAASLDEANLEPEPALEAAMNQPNRLAFERALRRLNQRGLHVTLLLDEFERLATNSHLDVNFFNALRSAAGRYQLAYITASAMPLIQLTYSAKAQEILSSPFFNIFAPLFLGMLAEDAMNDLIRQPSIAAGVQFKPETQQFLRDLAGGHPLTLQVACFHAINVLAEMPQAEPAEWHSAIEQRTMAEMAAHFEYYWRNLSLAEQNTLRQINQLTDRAAADTTLRGIVRDLVQKCLLCVQGMTYCYPSRAWASFVAAQQTPAPTPSQIGGLMTGTLFGPYEVLEPLGRGGMSEVYKGRHTRLERLVAIKILPAGLATEADFRSRFEREARGVAALRHANIVQVFDFGDINGAYYMVMEFIDGKDLSHHIRSQGKLTAAQILPILLGIGSALDYAHAQGLVHRDVKPSNVLLHHLKSNEIQSPDEPYRAVLTDFGIAKMLGGDTGATKTGLMMGTLNYMAPEQIRSSGEVDGKADIYALGVMLFHMITGRLPFPSDNPGATMLAHLQTPAPDPRQWVAEISNGQALAIMQAMEKDPADRFQTVQALIDTFRY